MFRRRTSRGFTLIETALATVIVGVGIVAALQLSATCTGQNQTSAQMSVAMMLASNVQEAMGGKAFADPGLVHTYYGPEPGENLTTYDDVDDFDAGTYNPPIDSLCQQIPDMAQYTQVVSVTPVKPNQLSVNSDDSSMTNSAKRLYAMANPGAARVRVRVLYRASAADVQQEVYRTSWIRMDN